MIAVLQAPLRLLLASTWAALASLGPMALASAQDLSQRSQDIGVLREMIREIEVEKKIVIFSRDLGPVVVERENFGFIAGWLVLDGRIAPGEVPAWTQQQLARSKLYLDTLKRELASLESGQPPTNVPPPAAPAGAADDRVLWPIPMDWLKVRGIVDGTYSVECKGQRNIMDPIRVAGTFRLVLSGDGKVSGTFDNPPTSIYGVKNGVILPAGTASGEAETIVPQQPSLRWAATFDRAGNELRMTSGTINLVPYGVALNCETGTLLPAPR